MKFSKYNKDELPSKTNTSPNDEDQIATLDLIKLEIKEHY